MTAHGLEEGTVPFVDDDSVRPVRLTVDPDRFVELFAQARLDDEHPLLVAARAFNQLGENALERLGLIAEVMDKGRGLLAVGEL